MKQTQYMFCMKQFKPAIVLVLVFTVTVVAWTAYQESTSRQRGFFRGRGAGSALMQTATAPPIRAGQAAPHPDFGKCTNCHDLIGAGGPKIKKVAATMLAATAPPIRPNQAAPHPDFGKCTNCHNMIPPPPPIRSFQTATHPDWGPCTDCHDIIGKGGVGAKRVAAITLVASVAPPMGGVWLKPITAATADRLGLENIDGVLVSGVNQQSPAYKAGLRVGDLIQRIDNEKVDTLNEALALISIKKPQDTVKLQVLHNGKQRKIFVEIASAPRIQTSPMGTGVAAIAPVGSRIAVAATGRDLRAQVAPMFSGAAAFILYDPASRQFTSIGNPGAQSLTAGRQAALQLINSGVKAVIVGNIGPVSLKKLQTAGIDVYTGAFGSVREVTNQYLRGTLVKAHKTMIPRSLGAAGGVTGQAANKIAVAATGPSLAAKVASDLGLAPYLIIYDVATGQAEAVAKDPAPNRGTSAVQTAHLVVDRGASAVIAGNISPTSIQTLSTLGVFSFAGVTGSVEQAIEMYRKGRLQATTVKATGRGGLAAALPSQQGHTI